MIVSMKYTHPEGSREQVLGILISNGDSPITLRHMADMADISYERVRQIIVKLERRGILQRIANDYRSKRGGYRYAVLSEPSQK